MDKTRTKVQNRGDLSAIDTRAVWKGEAGPGIEKGREILEISRPEVNQYS